jgi:hypothetical protein
MRNATATESATITRRLTGCIPASRFEMDTLCRLSGIKTTRAVPTAAVECTRRPRLLMNPDFIKQYCERDEHLFLLVMHELWHVMLAHTRMYPQMTQAQNIALDAIINAGIMRNFPGPEYRGFFDSINPANTFPHCLLRPPEGWPHNPVYPTDVGPPGTEEMIRRLYPARRIRRYAMPLYEEVLNLLLKSGMDFGLNMPVLLGNHDGQPIHDPLIKEMVKQATGKWPKMTMGGGGNGSRFGSRTFDFVETGDNVRRAFAQTLRLSVGRQHGRQYRKGKVAVPATTGTGVLPNPHDRMAPARRALGVPATLWAQPGEVIARTPEKPGKVHLYLDVSGSMNYILSYCLSLVLPYVAKGHADAFQFSTRVAELPLAELKRGYLSTTGGTNINCVLAHALDHQPKVNRILVFTDGETGAPTPELAARVIEEKLRINVVLPYQAHLHEAVREIALSVTNLPPLH